MTYRPLRLGRVCDSATLATKHTLIPLATVATPATRPELSQVSHCRKPSSPKILPAPAFSGGAWDPEEVRAYFEERAAIREHDGGMTREEAEAHAFGDVVTAFLPDVAPESRAPWINALSQLLGLERLIAPAKK